MGEFDDFFQPILANLDIKQRADFRVNEVLYSNSDDPEIVFILEKPPAIEDSINGKFFLDQKKINNFVKLVQTELKCIPRMKILSSIPFFLRKKDLNKNISIFYSENRIDLCKHIKPFSKVITEGRALYTITESTDLSIEGFYDFVFNEQHFYAPEIKSYVFPIDNFKKWFNKDNFENFFALNQIKNAYSYSFTPTRSIKPKLEVVEDTESFFREHLNKKKIALDIETSSLDFMTGEIGIVTMSFDGKTGYLLKWRDINVKLLSNFLKGKYLILANGKFDFKFLIKNGVDRNSLYCSFDTLHAGHLLNEMRGNSLKAHAWLYTKHGGYDKPLDKYRRRYKTENNFLNIPKEILYPYSTYDPIVTYQVYEAQERLIKKIDGMFDNSHSDYWTLWRCFNEMVMPYVNMFVDIEYEGIPVNWDKVIEVSGKLDKEIDVVRKNLYKELDINVVKKIEENLFEIIETEEAEINIDSGKELGNYLENIGWENYGKGKSNYYLTNDAILEKWEKDIKSKKGAELLLKYRELITLQKTFVGNENKKTGIWKYRRTNDRIYPTYGVMLTHSGRNWCKNPNLQNWPKHGEWAKLIRSMFITPSENYLFGEVDYSGLQLRIGAIYSGDEVMKKIFTELSGDMHTLTAVEVLARDVTLEYFLKHKKENPYKFIRFKAKGINFGFEFGQVAYSFAKDKIEREWTLEECKEYIKVNNLSNLLNKFKELIRSDKKNLDGSTEFAYYWCVAYDIRKKFFQTYKGLESWHKLNHIFANKNGFIPSSFGLIRRLPQLVYYETLKYYKKNKLPINSKVKNLYNIALNSPVQAFEIGIVSLGMIDVYNYIRDNNLKSRICGTIHDSCMFFIHKDEIDIMGKIIKEKFEKYRPEYKGIPIEVEGELSDAYAELGSEYYYENKGKIKDYRYWGFGKNWNMEGSKDENNILEMSTS